MADDQNALLDPQAQQEYIRQMAARRAAIAIPSSVQGTPALRGVQAPAAPTPTASPVAVPTMPSTGQALPAVVSPEQKQVTRAEEGLTKAQNITPATSKVMHAAQNIGNVQGTGQTPQELEKLGYSKEDIAQMTEGQGGAGGFLARHPTVGKIARLGGEVGAGVLRGVETAADIAAPRIMSQIPGTDLNKRAQVAQGQGQVSAAEKNQLEAAQAGEQEATAEQKKNMQAQIIAAREKGFDLQQDPITQKWTMSPLPASMLSAEQQATVTQKGEPKIETSPSSGEVVQLSPDPKNPGKMISSPVLDATGKPTVLNPKKEYEYKQEMQPDGKLHNVAYDKSDPTKKPIVLGEAKPAGGEGKVYDNYSKQLDKVSAPIDTMNAKTNLLMHNIGLRTKQADAVIAPEILSLTAGGQGSGLRMNEAEISRVLGGRSVWDSLKSSALKVQQGEGAFDDSQRAQLQQIAAYVQTRGNAAAFVLESGRKALLAAQDDDKAVRTVYSHMQGLLSQLDAKGITMPGTPLRSGDFTFRDGQLYQIEIEKGKPMGVVMEVK